VIAGFRSGVKENLSLLGFCAAYIGKLTLDDGSISCPETSVTNVRWVKSQKCEDPEIMAVHRLNRMEHIHTPCLQYAELWLLSTAVLITKY